MISQDSRKVIMLSVTTTRAMEAAKQAEEKIVGGRAKRFFRVVHVMETIDGGQQANGKDGQQKKCGQPINLKGERERIEVSNRGAGGSIVGEPGQGVKHAQTAADANAQDTKNFHQGKLPERQKGKYAACSNDQY
jgi:hypothetical protein